MVFSELYMITDKSKDFQATEEFVDRRMEDFYGIESFSSYVKKSIFIISFRTLWLQDLL